MTDRNEKPQTERDEDRERDQERVENLDEKTVDADDAQRVKGGLTNRYGFKPI